VDNMRALEGRPPRPPQVASCVPRKPAHKVHAQEEAVRQSVNDVERVTLASAFNCESPAIGTETAIVNDDAATGVVATRLRSEVPGPRWSLNGSSRVRAFGSQGPFLAKTNRHTPLLLETSLHLFWGHRHSFWVLVVLGRTVVRGWWLRWHCVVDVIGGCCVHDEKIYLMCCLCPL